MSMRPVSDWQSRLDRYLAGCVHRRFRWGQHDCGLFVAGAIDAKCAVDLAADLRGTYHSRESAAEAVQRLCGGSTVLQAAEHLFELYGCAAEPVDFAQRGDAVLLQMEQTELLGIVAMDGRLVAPGPRGLLYFRRQCAVRAWRVG